MKKINSKIGVDIEIKQNVLDAHVVKSNLENDLSNVISESISDLNEDAIVGMLLPKFCKDHPQVESIKIIEDDNVISIYPKEAKETSKESNLSDIERINAYQKLLETLIVLKTTTEGGTKSVKLDLDVEEIKNKIMEILK
jgi:hypothetical protein